MLPLHSATTRLGVALTLGALLALASPLPAWAQVANIGPGLFGDGSGGGKSAVGIALWYGANTLRTEAAPSTSTNEVKGYSDVLPGSITSNGPGLALSYGNFGFGFGYNEGIADVNAYADVNQTPGVPADDNFVISVRRTSFSYSIIYNPLRWAYVGYGQERGTMAFNIVDPGGIGSTRKLPFSNSFYTVGLAFGFDPQKGKFGPVFAAYTKIPASDADFTGAEYHIGYGVYF